MPKSKFFSPARLGLFAAACFILVFQASASRMLRIDETKIGIPGLHDIPWDISNWSAAGEQSMDPATVAYLKPDEYILRDYANTKNGSTIGVFVAYFKSLQNVYGPHSPRICLPGSGWLIKSSKLVTIAVPGRAEGIPVNQFTMEKGGQQILVLYWYQNDRDAWAEEYHAKLRLLPDLIRYHRSDVSLVRLIMPIGVSSEDTAMAQCRQFTKDIFPMLAKHFASVRTS